MNERIPVGISACLMGEPVRHDGGHKRSRYCTEVPMTLLRLAQRRHPQPYLAGQQYLQPYPDHLGLRNRV